MEAKQSIMIVEDDHYILEALQKKLELSGFEVIACLSAKQALDSLTKAIVLPDAICLDYYLPDMNGNEFMDHLQKNEVWVHIPVLILSNSDEEESIRSTLALGAKVYMLKTQYKMEDVIVQLRKIVSPVE